jgi:hypothetical protein
MEEVLAMSDVQRAQLRKECHGRVASAARNADPPEVDDLLVLDWLDIVFDEPEAPSGEARDPVHQEAVVPPNEVRVSDQH